MVDRCCSVPPEFGVLAPTAAPKSTREEPRHRLADRAVQCGGNRGVRWTGARGPLARIAVFGTFRQLRNCGTRRPPPMSVRGLSGVGLTSAPHRTFADPAPPLPTYSATPPPPDPIIPDATHPTCLSALPTTPVYRSRACRGATVGPSVADLCTLGDLPTCGIFVSCVPPVVP